MPLFYEFTNKGNDVADIFGGFEPKRRLVDFGARHHAVDVFDHLLRVLVRGDPRLFGARNDLVVHVGIISRIRNFVALLFEKFTEHVVNERLKRVSDVRLARYGNAARVHLYFALFQRLKGFFSTGERVIDLHGRPPLGNRFSRSALPVQTRAREARKVLLRSDRLFRESDPAPFLR